MAFSELERARIHKLVGDFCNRRFPAEIRAELRLEFSIHRQDVEIFTVRPAWDDPGKESHNSVAKLKFVRAAQEWRLYWQRADMRWHAYQPFPSSPQLADLVTVIQDDAHSCFFG